jgi:hypothetical protein
MKSLPRGEENQPNALKEIILTAWLHDGIDLQSCYSVNDDMVLGWICGE